jgi:hypothetical protein
MTHRIEKVVTILKTMNVNNDAIATIDKRKMAIKNILTFYPPKEAVCKDQN